MAQRSHTDANSPKGAPCKHCCQVSQNEDQYDRPGHIVSIPTVGPFSMGIEECPLVSLTWSILDFKIKRKEKFNASVSFSSGILTLGIDHKKVKALKMTSAQVVETSVKVTTNSPSQHYTNTDDHNFRT